MFHMHSTRSRKRPVVPRIVTALLAASLVLVASGLPGGLRQAVASGGCCLQELYVHTTTSANTFGDFTLLDTAVTNNNPNALVFVTANLNPGLSSAPTTNFDSHQTGVWYDAVVGKWAIFNEDGTSMPIGASFNVEALPGPKPAAGTFVQIAGPSNTYYGYITFLNNPLLNGNPNAMPIVTQNWNPFGSGGVYNNHAIGVWYDSAFREWTIYNEDRTTMPGGASFNVVSNPALVPFGGDNLTQVASSSNTIGDSTCINDSILNGAPDALAFLVHSYGTGGPYLTDATAVWYSFYYNEWCIFDNSVKGMPLGNSFFVYSNYDPNETG